MRGNDRNKTNCNGHLYNYSEVNIALNWTYDHPLHGAFDHSHNKAFWDYYYREYQRPADGKCDYSQNCHGYTFGAGVWVDSPWILLNAYPPANIQPCYVGATPKNATVACGPDHSIRVLGKECDLKVVAVPEPGAPVDGKSEIFIHSSEQFAESGTYSQTSTCQLGGVDINKAHVRDGASFPFLGIPVSGFPFFTYKPHGGN